MGKENKKVLLHKSADLKRFIFSNIFLYNVVEWKYEVA